MQLYKLLRELSESARYTKILNFHKANRKQIILVKFIVQPLWSWILFIVANVRQS